MKTLVAAGIGTLLFVLVSSSVFPSQQSVAKPAPAILEGRVVDAMTGNPVEDVDVGVAPASRSDVLIHTKTDANGQFQLSGIPPGRSVIGAFKEDYEIQPLLFALDPGQKYDGATFRLRRLNGVVSGRIVNPDGSPASRVTVILHRIGYNGFEALYLKSEVHPYALDTDPRSQLQVRTNDRGEYRA